MTLNKQNIDKFQPNTKLLTNVALKTKIMTFKNQNVDEKLTFGQFKKKITISIRHSFVCIDLHTRI